MSYRLITCIALFLSILFLPYWLYLTILLAALIAFPLFWEGIFFSFLIEVLYGPGMVLNPFHFSITLVTLLILIILLPLRERIRLHV